jgi:TrmH family RNA methyltransferase
LLPLAQRDQFDIILVAPRNPLNIGAVARALANFDFSHLTVVAPYEPHWREARSAVGAPDLLENARETATIAEAVANCTLVIGTGTVTHRKPEQPSIALPALAPMVAGELDRGGRIALVFGPEKHGLTREQLSWCHLFVEIPTDPRQPSMNLGQAAAVCLYELATRIPAAKTDSQVQPSDPGQHVAASGDLDILAGLVDEVMIAASYSPRTMQNANRHSLRILLRRLNLNPVDQRRILGLFRRILWRLRQSNRP